MRQRPYRVCAIMGAVALLFACHAGARAQTCDENNPKSPAGNTRVTLGTTDFTNEGRDELRSFVVTGSLGPVTATIVSATPAGIVRTLSATPQVSRYSSNYGEQLKGIDIHVALKRGDRSAAVSVSLRQVCAQYFRDTFLY
ncbi:MAG TPA: hypothetical protein VHW66_14615 [Stellaceae bacterium]|nr:hypothetical protein [Stellaceae bacterium]